MRKRHVRWALWVVSALVLLPLFGFVSQAFAGTIPHRAYSYRRDLVRNAHEAWGLNAPIAVFAAQVQQESRWRSDAVSWVGAKGMAQFMPHTAAWISKAYHLGRADPVNPVWALRALTLYDKYLWDRIQADDACSHMAMALSAYNGGLGWVYRDQQLTRSLDDPPGKWFGYVEMFNAGRKEASFQENRGYPRIILLRWTPVYASWGGAIECRP